MFRLPKASVALLTLLAFLSGTCTPHLAAGQNLLSKSEEQTIGKKVVTEVRKEFRVLDDPYLSMYLNAVGRRLVSAVERPQFDIDFHVVADSRINAFAVPGGHVFLTSQTVLLSEDENELAGVVAHEMGHVEARHMAQRLETSTKLNLAALAAIVAAAFLARSPQAGAAIASFAVAGAETKMLQYSRTDEEDADRRGLRTMKAAGYDGWGLVHFMETIHRQAPAPEGVPAYFFTHPLPENRASYLSELLPPEAPRRGGPPPGRLWRAQARVLSQDPRSWGRAMFEERVKKYPESADARLGLAVILKTSGSYDEALDLLAKAEKLAPEDVEIAQERASVWLRQGRLSEATALLESLRSGGRATAPVLAELGWVYLEGDQGPKALGVYDELARLGADLSSWGKLKYWRGMALGKCGREGEAHACLGDYYRDQDNYELTVRHYREALRKLAPGPERDRVEKELKDLPKPNAPAPSEQDPRRPPPR